MIAAFVDSLRELGYIEGQEFNFVYRSADGHLDRLPALVDDVISKSTPAGLRPMPVCFVNTRLNWLRSGRT
jgi:hypothetical protein